MLFDSVADELAQPCWVNGVQFNRVAALPLL